MNVVLEHAQRRGLEPYGVSFHVGSQQRNQHAWDRALASAAAVFKECGERGRRQYIAEVTMVGLFQSLARRRLQDDNLHIFALLASGKLQPQTGLLRLTLLAVAKLTKRDGFGKAAIKPTRSDRNSNAIKPKITSDAVSSE